MRNTTNPKSNFLKKESKQGRYITRISWYPGRWEHHHHKIFAIHPPMWITQGMMGLMHQVQWNLWVQLLKRESVMASGWLLFRLFQHRFVICFKSTSCVLDKMQNATETNQQLSSLQNFIKQQLDNSYNSKSSRKNRAISPSLNHVDSKESGQTTFL